LTLADICDVCLVYRDWEEIMEAAVAPDVAASILKELRKKNIHLVPNMQH
jgi:hypothetical protein